MGRFSKIGSRSRTSLDGVDRENTQLKRCASGTLIALAALAIDQR